MWNTETLWFEVSMLQVIYVHGVLLPGKGINGLTGEPKGKYCNFRGWDKDIFGRIK